MSEADCVVEASAILTGRNANGTFDVLLDHAVLIEAGKIAQIAPRSVLATSHPQMRRVGGQHLVAMPGLVNSHHHSGITPLMHGVPFAPLEFWLPQFRALRSVPSRLDTLYSAIEMLESGTTTVHHIHGGIAGPSESWAEQSDTVIAAYREIGMRVGYSLMIRDRNRVTYDDDAELLSVLPPEVGAWLASQLAQETAPIRDLMGHFRALKARWREADTQVRLNLAPANLHWLSDDALVEIFATARDEHAQLHMHLVETERQSQFALDRFGHSAVAHLAELGCLTGNLTLGHGNWLSRDDLDLLAQHQCSICHNASSGLRLGSGIAPVNVMLERGLQLALGIDQSGINDDRDMLAEMKLVFALHRETGLFNARASAAQILQMATEHGARTAGFGAEVGRLEIGQAADIVLLDRARVERPVVDARTPLVDTVVLRGTASAVDKVLIGGHLVVDGGKVQTIDRDAVLDEIAMHMRRPLSAAEQHGQAMVEMMMPHLVARHADPASHRPYRYNRMAD